MRCLQNSIPLQQWIISGNILFFLVYGHSLNHTISSPNTFFTMKNISFEIGYWAAIILTITFAVWIVAFIGIAITSPLFFWTNLNDYIIYFQSNGRFFQNLAYVFMLFAGPVYVLLVAGYYDHASDSKKVLIRISMLFALAYATLSSLHYFVQLSAVRLNLLKGNFEGIEYFLQANPVSIMNSVVMLGWSLFLGLSSLFIFPVFEGKDLNRLLRLAFLVNGISCMIAGAGYIFQIDAVTFFFGNFVTGGAIMIISIASIKKFKKLMSPAQ